MSHITKERACVGDSCRQGCDSMSATLGGLLFLQDGSKHKSSDRALHSKSRKVPVCSYTFVCLTVAAINNNKIGE
jgi:hypothetical protein